MAFTNTLLGINAVVLAGTVATAVFLSSLLTYLFNRPSFPKNAPPLSKESWPIVGALSFFSERWEFYKRAHKASKTGHFSFYVGQNPVIGLSAAEESTRRLFFDSKALSAAEAYSALLAGVPSVKRNVVVNPGETNFDLTDKDAKLRYRMITMMKAEKLAECIPWMIRDVQKALDALASDSKCITNPFQSVYRIVFQLTARLSACDELADDEKLSDRTLYFFEMIAGATNPLMIMFPWMPLWGKAKRMYGGIQLFTTFKKLMDGRKTGAKEPNDTLQMLVNLKDSTVDVIEFVISALFAGQANTGFQASWILCHLTRNPEWMRRVREEIASVADKYCPDKSLSLPERLSRVPFNGWDGEFPMIYLCLRDVMRLGMPGTIFRKNVSDRDIQIPGTEEVIPQDAYVAMHVFDTHLNPDIWDDPEKWDPSRYLPDRAEDKRQPYSWMGWGHGRHPCLGMRFARLEVNMIVAFWCAYFPDFDISDAKGNRANAVPSFNFNRVGTHKPDSEIYLKYQTS